MRVEIETAYSLANFVWAFLLAPRAGRWARGLRPLKHRSSKLDQGGLPADQPTAPPLCGSFYVTASSECKTVGRLCGFFDSLVL